MGGAAAGGRRRGARIAAWVLAAGSMVAAAPGCGILGSRPDEVLISAADMAGTWTTKDGRITLRLEADRRASVTGLLLGPDCGREGSWEFYVRDSDTSTHIDPRATEGYEGAVSLRRSGADPSDHTAYCGSLYPSVFRIHGAYVLCLEEDPDSFCSDDELLHKAPQAG